MAEETVVKETLSDSMIEMGKRLVLALDQEISQINAAYWLYYDNNIWRLFFVSKEVLTDGTKKVYKKVQFVLSKEKTIKIDLKDISVVGPNDFFYNLLHIAINTPNRSIVGIRFTHNTINGFFIDDAYIYRMS